MAESITYLMEADPGGAGYFHEAKGFFSQASDMTVVETAAGTPARTLDDVFNDLRARAKGSHVFGVINLVTHATGFSSLQFPISDARRDKDGGLILADTLIDALRAPGTAGYPNRLGPPAVTKDTTVCLYGCDVGRDAAFLQNLGLLFGDDVTIKAPLRVAIFRHAGTTFEHRLGRTWAVNAKTDVNKATDWPGTRTRYLAAAATKFLDATTTATIKAAAAAATHSSTASFFFSESLGTSDDPATTTIEGSSAVLQAGTDDDTTKALTVKSSDFAKDPTVPGAWVAWVAVLAQVIEQPVTVDSDSQFRTTVIRAGKAVSPGPKPSGGGAGPPPPPPPTRTGLLDTARDAYVAAGGTAGDLDTLLAGLADAPAGDPSFTDPGLSPVESGTDPLGAESFA